MFHVVVLNRVPSWQGWGFFIIFGETNNMNKFKVEVNQIPGEESAGPVVHLYVEDFEGVEKFIEQQATEGHFRFLRSEQIDDQGRRFYSGMYTGRHGYRKEKGDAYIDRLKADLEAKFK